MEMLLWKQAREQQCQGTADAAAHQPAQETAAVHEGGSQQLCSSDPQPSSTHILDLPHHLISLILPQVSDAVSVHNFLTTSKTAHNLSSDIQVQADWLQRQRPASALFLAAGSRGKSETLLLELLNRPTEVTDVQLFIDGNMILSNASIAGYSQAVRRLLQLGVNPNVTAIGNIGYTPLMEASCEGHAAVVQELLQADGINVNHKFRGSTALHVACKWNHPGVVKEFVHAGVNTMLPDLRGRTPLDLARLCKLDEIVTLLDPHTGHT